MIAKAPITPAYFEQMRCHVDEGGQLNHRNGLDLLAEVERLQDAPVAVRESLAFYADKNNWQSPSSGFVLQYDPEPSPISKDQGQRASAALASVSGAGTLEDTRSALQYLAGNIQSKVVQLKHYRDNNCQTDHAKTIAEGRILQASQILHWVDTSLAALPQQQEIAKS
jgi:hypothetical protein